MPSSNVTVGILLSAGHSRRFGKPEKLLAMFRGQPLISYAALAMVNSDFDHRIAVVSSDDVSKHLSDFQLVKVENSTQSESLIAGLTKAEELGADRVEIILADMPFITPNIIKLVAARCNGTAATAVTDGEKRMPPVCIPKQNFMAIYDLDGDCGARSILQDLPLVNLVEVAPETLRDVDEIQDLKM